MRIFTGLLAFILITLPLAPPPALAQTARALGEGAGEAAPAKKPAALDDGEQPAAAAPAAPAGIELNVPPPAPPTMPAMAAKPVPFGPPPPPVSPAPPDQASDIIGTVVQAEGPVSIHSANGRDLKAIDKTPVHLHDTVSTGKDGRVLILLIDNSRITLGENAAFGAGAFVFDPDAPAANRLRLNFPQGIFKYAGGNTDKTARAYTTLSLPTGMTQVRGATLWGGPSSDGYSIFVLNGDVAMTTPRGRVIVRKGQGTSMRDARDTPSRPAAWPPDRITEIIRATQITDAKSASAKLELARSGQRVLIARYKAWELKNGGETAAGARSSKGMPH